MREYGRVSPLFWTGATGRALRGDHLAQAAALYLVTSPDSTMLGIYSLPVPTLAHHLGCPIEGASKALARLSEIGFAHYDPDEEVIWVPEMARYQICETLEADGKKPDKRILGIEREIENFRKCKFFKAFLDRYAKPFKLKTKLKETRGIQAPSKPLASQEQAQEQAQAQEQEQKDLSAKSPTAVPVGASDAELVFEEWRRVMGKTAGALFTPEREKKVRARLKEGYGVERLFKAIRGCKASPHHQGQNEHGTVYDDLELICRDGKHVEAFEGFCDKPPVARGQVNGHGRRANEPAHADLQSDHAADAARKAGP